LNSLSVDKRTRAAILVVDDDDSVLTLVHLCLKHAGYNVAAARGRERFLSSLTSSRHFDLVITDLLMPEISGTEVIEATKIHQPNAAILAMSGGAPHLVGAMILKIADFPEVGPLLMKPFHLDELLDAVENALQRSKASAAAK
jgi:DNA-binding NtrC family response regulator